MVEAAGVEPACLLFSQGASFCILAIERMLIYTHPIRQLKLRDFLTIIW